MRIPDGPRPPRRALVSPLDPGIERDRSIIARHQMIFLDEERAVEGVAGWQQPTAPRLWIYNLHYLDGLANPDTPAALKEQVVDDWLANNPPGEGPGWEPYPTSLRIVNLIKWVLTGGPASAHLVESLALQSRALLRTLEYHLLGNHLFANAKALIAAGLFFEGREADRWLKKGESILRSQLDEQFLADGSHFELSPVYHALLTEDLLDLLSLYAAFGRSAPTPLEPTCRRALAWLSVMTRPDGLPPLFNDAAYGVAPTFGQLREKARRIGVPTERDVPRGTHHLVESGYVRHEDVRYSCFADVGQIGPEYIPGHAHCDMLSFELFADGRPVIVDTGTSTYDVGPRRHVERGTASHNTVQVGDLEQSEIWASFRVGRRARIVNAEQRGNEVVAEARVFPPSRTKHSRTFRFEPGKVILEDEIRDAPRESGCVARFHLHHDLPAEIVGSGVRVGDISFSFSGGRDVVVTTYEYAPRFNQRFPAKVLEVSFDRRLLTEISL